MADHFDFCVVGAGTAGYSAAQTARQLGKSVALVEGPGELAGLCILRGCMPAKTVLESADKAHEIEKAPEFGIDPENIHIDTEAIIGRKRALVQEFKEDRLRDLRTFPIFRGAARFTSRGALSVDQKTITAAKFLIATGSIIDAPPIPGLSDAKYMTSSEALEATRIPKSLVVLGGGPVGCEFAQYFVRLGAEVTLVQDAATLLMKEDEDIGEALRASFEAEGINVITDAVIERVVQKERTEVHLRGRAPLSAHALFLAMGRRPNVDSLDLERAGVRASHRGIEVDAYLRTANPDIFAAGDVIGRRGLVHTAEHGGKLAGRNAFAATPRAFDFDLYECRSVYTHPEVAVAGLNERTLRERGIAYERASYAFADLGRALTANVPEGFIKMLAAPDGKILGIAYVGAQASDLIHEATTLLHFGANVCDVIETPHLHPTLSEVITYPAQELCERLGL